MPGTQPLSGLWRAYTFTSAVLQRMQRLLSEWRRQHPMAGTRSTLVAPPGWVAPKDWALAVVPASLLQPSWKNTLPFSKEILDATAQRGVLVDEATKRAILERDARQRPPETAPGSEPRVAPGVEPSAKPQDEL